MNDEEARPFRALGDPVRWVVLRHLAAAPGEVGASELADVVTVGQPTLSYHLAVLREAGLIERRKEGRQHFHRIRPEAVAELAEFLEAGLLKGPTVDEQTTA
ncbi:metalloregulator ArsR/SmtB family transcription factor [Amycolatopsis acidiphila]|nr:metalloregulator ArsR/SmtB family transcription factor [Amycolatopsis acidiphila]UIJ57170.1 metalloregulator ArsR/SmtB family transcription factor [Amycolatopsis acidiphila]GHG52915.1 transcriptional regulator [Amycolatopsis acidiphila]